jgi:fido (protein-threonine AMPylation protein)
MSETWKTIDAMTADAELNNEKDGIHDKIEKMALQKNSWWGRTNWINTTKIKPYLSTPEQIQRLLLIIPQMFPFSSQNQYYEPFYTARLIILLWRGHKLETGYGATRQQIAEIVSQLSTLQIANPFSQEQLASFESNTQWDAEGVEDLQHNSGWIAMGTQSARAYLLLSSAIKINQRLGVEEIKSIHRVLMSGALPNPGQFRNTNVMADNYVFCRFEDVHFRIEKTLNDFEQNVERKERHPIEIAVDLMLEFVTIHPFINGNGRMCRLLFSYALKEWGFHFPLDLAILVRKTLHSSLAGHNKFLKRFIVAVGSLQSTPH